MFQFKDFSLLQFSKSFPSDWLLRKCSLLQATRDTMLLGHRLLSKKTYLACDKGNKKGIGHFVKVLSWWDYIEGTAKVHTQVLDIDACGGTSNDCGLGVQSSMNKLKANDADDTHRLNGQCTVNGGSGVLEGLCNAMLPLNLCAPSDYLIANCCIHSLQIQLGNAIKTTFGEGAIDRVNATQMLHSVC